MCKLLPMNTKELTLKEMQDYIRAHYYQHDQERGTAGTFMWLIEEIGELSTALQNITADPSNPAFRQNLQEEFGDVLGWLSTLANMHGIDLGTAFRLKYMDKADPGAHKS
ncbi:MAG: MazG nucleotide pyrophosphohydrolase domain-containing protein [bacterium]|nr:MazG nucleotide pyrophosphohydrolase domain-containing protein [bacterium]